MGGRSSSATNNYTRTDNSSRVVDQSNAKGDTVLSVGGNKNKVKIKKTDLGAIKGALGFATDALAVVNDTSKRMQEASLEAAALAGDMAGRQIAASQSTNALVADLAETFQSDGKNREQKTMLLLAGGTLLAVVVVVAIVNYGGK